MPRVDADAVALACRTALGASPPEAGPDEGGARALLAWLVERVARRRLAEEALRAAYCARAPRQVLGERCVPFTAPCADLSAIAALLLARAGIESTLVLGGIARAFRPVKFQCGLEVDIGEGTWVVGFGISRTFFYRGRFEPTPRRPWVFRRRPEDLDLDRPFLSYFCDEGRAGLSRRVPGYDLERDLRDHARRSGRIPFLLARRRARAESRSISVPALLPWEAA